MKMKYKNPTVKAGVGFQPSGQDLAKTYRNLLQRHRASFDAAETLQRALEGVGLELLDTGALYNADGEQEGPRDLVMGVPDTETEYAFRVYHDPRKAETDGDLPTDVAEAVAKWEGGQ